jgi:hypothetical protein
LNPASLPPQVRPWLQAKLKNILIIENGELVEHLLRTLACPHTVGVIPKISPDDLNKNPRLHGISRSRLQNAIPNNEKNLNPLSSVNNVDRGSDPGGYKVGSDFGSCDAYTFSEELQNYMDDESASQLTDRLWRMLIFELKRTGKIPIGEIEEGTTDVAEMGG